MTSSTNHDAIFGAMNPLSFALNLKRFSLMLRCWTNTNFEPKMMFLLHLVTSHDKPEVRTGDCLIQEIEFILLVFWSSILATVR